MRIEAKFEIAAGGRSMVSVGFAATRTKVSAGEHFVPPDITAASDVPVSFRQRGVQGSCGLAVNVNPREGTCRMCRRCAASPASARGGDERREYVELFARQDGWEPKTSSTINVQVIFNPGTPQTQGLQLPPGALTRPASSRGTFPAARCSRYRTLRILPPAWAAGPLC